MGFSRLDLTLDSREEIRCKVKFQHVIKKTLPKIHFSKDEAEALLIVYYKLTKRRPMDRKYFRDVMFKLFDYSNDVLIERIYSVFGDAANKTELTMESWVLGLSVICRGTLEEKIKYCFTVYDMMGDGMLRKDFMLIALKNNFRDDESKELLLDLIETLVKKMDVDMDGVISYEDYRNSVLKNNFLLEPFGYCVPSRAAIYTFLTTMTSLVTTMHSNKTSRSNLELVPSKTKFTKM
ncbi:calaxin-like [Macrosteles quadrilineatus]|uniref:calaxin-like n=1 Tax=Macrosteles quadrilineatus TaxID=74068 RepID=UPI0023E298C7|nr:calaxin-like [Macrosteles quadrilineatus]XP_054262018.1 calaxin-like [Macrosteles quadrilineatus]